MQPSQNNDQQALAKVRPLWQQGDIFHNFSRYPTRSDLPRVDRLACMLEKGLVPPSLDPTRDAVSDLRIVITGSETPYDSVIFLHQMSKNSGIYITSKPGHCTVLIDQTLRLLTKEDMGAGWPVLSPYEKYYKGIIPPEKFTGLVVHPNDASAIVKEFQRELRRLVLPVYAVDGRVLWPCR